MPPNPIEPPLSSTQPTNQPTIRNFLRRSVRESVANVMDIDLPATQESRKRDRDDIEDGDSEANLSLNGPDILDRALSDSLINNTSLLPDIQEARRRRVSSADVQSPSESSTPNPIILQMREIRQAIQTSGIPGESTSHEAPALDSITATAAINIQSRA